MLRQKEGEITELYNVLNRREMQLVFCFWHSKDTSLVRSIGNYVLNTFLFIFLKIFHKINSFSDLYINNVKEI